TVQLLVPLDDGRTVDPAVRRGGDADCLQPVLVQALQVSTDLRRIRAEVRARRLRDLLSADDEAEDRLGVDVLRRHEHAVMLRPRSSWVNRSSAASRSPLPSGAEPGLESGCAGSR